jgi:hypothetical protein
MQQEEGMTEAMELDEEESKMEIAEEENKSTATSTRVSITWPRRWRRRPQPDDVHYQYMDNGWRHASPVRPV